MNPFKRGDIVRCRNAVGLTRVHHGKAYKVADIDPTCVIVYVPDGASIDVSRVRADRFTLVTKANGVTAALTPRAVTSTYNNPQFDYVQPIIAKVIEGKPVETRYMPRIPSDYGGWCKFLAAGGKLKFRSGCDVKFVALCPDAKPHCQLVLLNPATGNIVTRYANGKGSTEPYDEPGDILIKE